MKLHMTNKGVSESLVDLEATINDNCYFMNLPDEFYNEIKKYFNPLHKSMYCVTRADANIKWKSDDIPNNFEQKYNQARINNKQQPDKNRINDIIRYSNIMRNNLEDGFPTILLMKQGNHLVQVDGARRLMARLLAEQYEIPIFIILLREDIKNIIDTEFIKNIQKKHKSKRWFNDYQDILELGIQGKRRYGGRFPNHLNLDLVKNKTVVDFGCSNGMALLQAYYCGAQKCIGFDYVEQNVDIINLLANKLKIKVEAYEMDFNDDYFERDALELTGGWDYSLFLSVYRTKELKDRTRLLKFIWENSKEGMFFETHCHPQLDSIDFYNEILGQLKNSEKIYLGKGIIERPYDNGYRHKFLIKRK